MSITPAPPRYVESPEYTKFLSTVTAYRAGDVAAAMALGTYYYNGTVTGKRHSAAFTTWLSLADRNLQARFLVGRMLYFGEGTPADTDRGFQMMRSAAAAGYPDAVAYLKALPPMRAGTVGEFPSMLTFVKDAFRESPRIGPGRATIGRVKSRSAGPADGARTGHGSQRDARKSRLRGPASDVARSV